MTWKELIELLKNSKEAEEVDNKREDIASWIPAVREMFDYDQNSNYHQYDLWMHCIHTMLGIPKDIDDDMLYLAALLHDISKPKCRCKGDKDDSKSSYFGHQDVSEQIVRKEVIPYISNKGEYLSAGDIERLLYYVKYHDDRASLKEEYLLKHLKIVDTDTFKKLMILEVADAKAHVVHPAIQKRIDICSVWIEKQ